MVRYPFEVKSCALIVQMDGEPAAINLRELRDRVARCSLQSFYHHFIETQLRPTFDDPEFTNDFATWAYRALRDDILAERLGSLDPFRAESMESLRADVLEILDDRLSEVEHIPWTTHGHAFYFMRAHMAVFDTGMRIKDSVHIPSALHHMTRASLYYHFVEARSRHHGGSDDFTEWLRTNDEVGSRIADAFSRVDVQFFSLRALRRNLIRLAEEVLRGEEGRSQ